MVYAIDKNGSKVKASPNVKALCPNCKYPVIAKCGELNVWHWAHENLTNCDTWNYEPITAWHLGWQEKFNIEQREVYLHKFSQYHIPDIVTKKGLVIEFQNSEISTYEIHERERFYEQMIWVIKAKEFKHNLKLKEFPVDAWKESFLIWIVPNDFNGYCIKIPFDPHTEQILESLKLCNYKKDYDEDTDIEFWYNKKKDPKQKIEKEVLNAFSGYFLDTKLSNKLDDITNYPTNFKWLHLRKSWLSANMPLFLDLNNGYLFWIKRLYDNGNGFGQVFSKRKFLKKYIA